MKTRAISNEGPAVYYGRKKWTRRQDHYTKLHTVHYQVLLYVIRAHHKGRDNRTLSFNRALETECESIETTLRTKGLKAGALIQMGDGEMPKRIMFGALESAVKRGRCGREKEWT